MSLSPQVIPEFTEDFLLDPFMGRHDRILLTLRGWSLSGTAEQIGSFREHLTGTFEPAHGEPFNLFNAPNGTPRRYKWPISGGGHTQGPQVGRPLFAGRLIAQQGAGTIQTGQWTMWAELSLNPTRWVLHQPTTLLRYPEQDWEAIPPRMSVVDRPFLGNERPLVRSTNTALGTPRHLTLALPSRWNLQLRRYCHGVLATLETAMSAAAELSGASWQRTSEEIAIREVEVHWEFWCNNPLAVVASLERQFRTIAASSSIGWQTIDAPETAFSAIEVGSEDNSPRISVRLGSGVHLKIYAKTNRRVRIEVTFDCAKARTTFPQSRGNYDRLFEWLETARTSAADRVNSALEALRAGQDNNAQPKPPHELITDIYGAVGDPEQARQLVEILVTTGRIITYPHAPLNDVVVRMRRRGILRNVSRTGNSRAYSVTTPYAHALDTLRGH